jgi:cysteinyl-tRNA synthetase
MSTKAMRAGCFGAMEKRSVCNSTVSWPPVAEVNDDLNLSRALAVVWELVKSDLPPATLKATTGGVDAALGLGLRDWRPVVSNIPEDVRELLDEREQARAERDWTKADNLRKALNARGWRVEDSAEGQRVSGITADPIDSSRA